MMEKISRRKFIYTSSLVGGLAFAPYTFGAKPGSTKIQAIMFDGFPIFDPRPVFKKVNELFPEKGKQLVDIWRAKQFSYQWLRASGHQYKNFWDVTCDALRFAGAECNINLTESDVKKIMDGYLTIDVWPDVIPALQSLKEKGLKLSFLTNMTEEMIVRSLQNSNTQMYFDQIISTDRIQTFKPSPSAYQMGVDALKLRKEEILFVAFAGWDAAGAKWFGYPTFWLNRLNSVEEYLDARPDAIGTNLSDLLIFLDTANKH